MDANDAAPVFAHVSRCAHGLHVQHARPADAPCLVQLSAAADFVFAGAPAPAPVAACCADAEEPASMSSLLLSGGGGAPPRRAASLPRDSPPPRRRLRFRPRPDSAPAATPRALAGTTRPAHAFALTARDGSRVYCFARALSATEALVACSKSPDAARFLPGLDRAAAAHTPLAAAAGIRTDSSSGSSGSLARAPPERPLVSAWLTFHLASTCGYPAHPLADASAVLRLPPRALAAAVVRLLEEGRVAVVGPCAASASRAVLALDAVLAPFAWPHLLLPSLPDGHLPVLAAPFPYLVGLTEEQLEEARAHPLDDVLVARLDAGNVEAVCPTEEATRRGAPRAARLRLERALARARPANGLLGARPKPDADAPAAVAAAMQAFFAEVLAETSSPDTSADSASSTEKRGRRPAAAARPLGDRIRDTQMFMQWEVDGAPLAFASADQRHERARAGARKPAFLRRAWSARHLTLLDAATTPAEPEAVRRNSSCDLSRVLAHAADPPSPAADATDAGRHRFAWASEKLAAWRAKSAEIDASDEPPKRKSSAGSSEDAEASRRRFVWASWRAGEANEQLAKRTSSADSDPPVVEDPSVRRRVAWEKFAAWRARTHLGEDIDEDIDDGVEETLAKEAASSADLRVEDSEGSKRGFAWASAKLATWRPRTDDDDEEEAGEVFEETIAEQVSSTTDSDIFDDAEPSSRRRFWLAKKLARPRARPVAEDDELVQRAASTGSAVPFEEASRRRFIWPSPRRAGDDVLETEDSLARRPSSAGSAVPFDDAEAGRKRFVWPSNWRAEHADVLEAEDSLLKRPSSAGSVVPFDESDASRRRFAWHSPFRAGAGVHDEDALPKRPSSAGSAVALDDDASRRRFVWPTERFAHWRAAAVDEANTEDSISRRHSSTGSAVPFEDAEASRRRFAWASERLAVWRARADEHEQAADGRSSSFDSAAEQVYTDEPEPGRGLLRSALRRGRADTDDGRPAFPADREDVSPEEPDAPKRRFHWPGAHLPHWRMRAGSASPQARPSSPASSSGALTDDEDGVRARRFLSPVLQSAFAGKHASEPATTLSAVSDDAPTPAPVHKRFGRGAAASAWGAKHTSEPVTTPAEQTGPRRRFAWSAGQARARRARTPPEAMSSSVTVTDDTGEREAEADTNPYGPAGRGRRFARVWAQNDPVEGGKKCAQEVLDAGEHERRSRRLGRRWGRESEPASAVLFGG